MNIKQLREFLDEANLDSTGTKNVLKHRLSVEWGRVDGKDTAQFNPALLTVKQLHEWLDARSVDYPTSRNKPFYVKLVSKIVADEEAERKSQDVDSMTTDDIKKWLQDNDFKAKSDRDREYYVKKMKKNIHTDADGIFLFTEKEVLFQKKLFFGQRLVVVEGDISKCAAEAVVHPTNGGITLGGGVGRALASAGGPLLQAATTKWALDNPQLKYTACCMTPGHELPAKNVIHSYSPVYEAHKEDQAKEDLGNSITNIFQLAEDNEIANIALPSIGSGMNGYPQDLAAETILRAITDYFQEAGASSFIKQVYFVLYGKASVDVYTKQLVKL